MTEINVHPEIAEVDWIDDAFYIKETRYGLFTSVKKNGDNFAHAECSRGVQGCTLAPVYPEARYLLRSFHRTARALYLRCPNMEAFLSDTPCWICPSICPGVPQSVLNLPQTSLNPRPRPWWGRPRDAGAD